jgi:Repeat of unknown function (DUF5648)
MTKHRSSLGYLYLCFASLLFACSVAKAHTFTTIPSIPYPSTPVQLAVEGYGGLSTPWYLYDFAIAGNTITVNACEPPGFATPSPYSFLVNLGLLEPGTYSVRYYMYDCGPPDQMGVPSSPTFVTGYTFQVFPSTPPSALTIVPSLSSTGTTLLTISGLRDYFCYATDQTNVAVASHVITIDTENHHLFCFSLIPPQFFSITVDVGYLPAGHYVVAWSFDPPLSTSLPPTSFEFDAAAPVGTSVEYYYEAWNYYFQTSSPDEIAVLDGGAFGGVWKRTGETFNVWPQANAASSPTCRFFSNSFAPKSTHVYTPFASECATLKADPKWQYEGIAFHVQLADTAGLCAAGTIPLYRLYNNQMGGAPNHRYTTSETILNQMIVAGWVFEGNASTRVFACVPQ